MIARLRLAAALAAVATLASACASASPSATGSKGTSGPVASISTSSTTSTTTSTTLPPVEVSIPGTLAGGSFGSLGAVERVAVLPVPDGSATLPASPPASSGSGSTSTTVAAAGSTPLAFRQFGSGPDLLLIGGEHASMAMWDPVFLGLLAHHYTVTELDLPGTGYSGAAVGGATLNSTADLIAGLSATLALNDPVVVGWGLGGEIAIDLAERHPKLAGGLVLLDASAGGPTATKPSPSVAAQLASPILTRLELADLFFPSSATAASTGYLNRLNDMPPDDLVASAITEEAALVNEAANDPALAAGLSKIALRTLVVAGALDAIEPPANAALLMRHLRHARELILPGAGYASSSMDASQLALAIEAFTTPTAS